MQFIEYFYTQPGKQCRRKAFQHKEAELEWVVYLLPKILKIGVHKNEYILFSYQIFDKRKVPAVYRYRKAQILCHTKCNKYLLVQEI